MRTRDHLITEQKRALKANAPSKRIKVNHPLDKINQTQSNERENVPVINKKQVSTRATGRVPTIMEVEPQSKKKKFSFDTKPYATEVHQSQFQTEKRFFSKIGQGIIWEGNPINQAMRNILVNWLSEVVEEYKMRSQTLFLAVTYLDRFLQSTKDVHRHLLQLVGVACLWISAKFEEIDVPDVDEFVYITDNTYSAQEIISTERYILNKLDYDLACVTVHNFIFRFLEVGGVTTEQSSLTYHAKFLAELSLTYYPINRLFSPSLIAASIVCIVKQSNNMHPVCTPQLLNYTTYTKEQLNPCIQHLLFATKNSLLQSQTAMIAKYKKDSFKNVANISLPELVEI